MTARSLRSAVKASLALASFTLVSSLASAGCGGAPPPAPEAPTDKPMAAPAAAPPDLSPLEEPKGLVLFGRIKKPREALKVVGAWTHFPMPGAEVAAELMAGESVGKIIDLDQPIDVAVVSDPARRSMMPQWAVAAAVTSLDDAKTAFSERYKLVPGDNGALVIQGLGGPGGSGDDDDSEDGGRACEIAPAAGDSSVRLVCGPTDAAVRAIAPFLTRTSPRTAIPSDLHVELRLAPIKAFALLARTQLPAMLRGLGVSSSRDPALSDLIDAATGELVDLIGDLDKVTLDAKLEEARAGGTLTTTFSGNTSATARLLTGHPERVDLPPPAFGKLPNDSDFAFYQRGLDPKEIERPRGLVLRAVAASMTRDGLPEADATALTDVFAKMLSGAPVVVGRGIDSAALQKALSAQSAAKDDAAREQASRGVLDATLGWWVVGLEESPGRWQANVKELVAAWSRPAVAKWLKDQAGTVPPPTLRLTSENAAQLPKDTSRLELTFYEPVPPIVPKTPAIAPKGAPPPKPKPQPPRATKVHALVVPDAGRTWLVLAADEQAAVAKARMVTGSTESATLSARAGLESTKQTRASSAGFATLRGLATLSVDALDRVRRGRTSDPVAALLTSGQGQTPIPYAVTSAAGSAGAPAGSVVVTGDVPRNAIEELIRIVMRGGRL